MRQKYIPPLQPPPKCFTATPQQPPTSTLAFTVAPVPLRPPTTDIEICMASLYLFDSWKFMLPKAFMVRLECAQFSIVLC